MRLDLCLPARNEAAHIQDAIRRLVRALGEFERTTHDAQRITPGEGNDWRIIVAINGTMDDTLDKVEEYRISNIEYRERIITLQCPATGKGAAIRFAAAQSNADIFGFIDADLSSDPDAIPELVKLIVDGKADIVIASRLVQTRTTNRGFARTLSSRFFNLMAHLILGLKVKDAQCGLKVMSAKARGVLLQCREDGWFLDIEFLAKARQDGLTILEVPVPWIEFRYPDRKSQIKHVRDGIGAIKAMLRIRKRLTPPNLPLQQGEGKSSLEAREAREG